MRMCRNLRDTRSIVIRALLTENDLAQALAQRGLPPDADLWDLLRHERSIGHVDDDSENRHVLIDHR